ncbi:GNAT family N-acetyltransferase [Roseobacter sp. CCS2]|uniref:GNAT family N-acetyltransferase n=1 Tax=Roseobacter sp. CCS2 TaxID=391593 RepID=UPI0000F3E597|nr:GNAT family N-acetyltransferase [Roseobacter sp. CCS2]EBA11023.1 acetyltransferase [Roseobacter sp. CCS2]
MTGRVAIKPLSITDSSAALTLYNELTFGPKSQNQAAFASVIAHSGTTIYGAFDQDALVAMLTLHLLPNVTWNARSYALIENVITTATHRKRGIGKQLMEHAIAQAWAANAFKIMLMTGQKRAATGFYESVGFSAEDKTAMVIRRPDT